MEKNQSEVIQNEIESFHLVWKETFKEVLNTNYVDKLTSLCKVEKTEQAVKVYQTGVEDATKIFCKRLKRLSDKYGFKRVIADSMEALNFNLLIAELLRIPDLPFTEEELMGFPYNTLEQEAYIDKLEEIERLNLLAKKTEEFNTKLKLQIEEMREEKSDLEKMINSTVNSIISLDLPC